MYKVSIIEDHSEFREGLAYLLTATEGFECVNTFSSAEDAIENLSGKEEVILLDINLPKLSGVDAIPIIKQEFPHLKIIMLTVYDDDDNIIRAILAGADGYLLKKSSPLKILSSLEECMEGGCPMTPAVAKKVINIFKHYIPSKSESYSLTKRELEILQLLVNGLENKDVAEKLFISIETLRNHLRHIYEKLHVHSKSQAIIKAMKQGIL